MSIANCGFGKSREYRIQNSESRGDGWNGGILRDGTKPRPVAHGHNSVLILTRYQAKEYPAWDDSFCSMVLFIRVKSCSHFFQKISEGKQSSLNHNFQVGHFATDPPTNS